MIASLKIEGSLIMEGYFWNGWVLMAGNTVLPLECSICGIYVPPSVRILPVHVSLSCRKKKSLTWTSELGITKNDNRLDDV